MAPYRQFNRHPELLDNEISPTIIRSSNHNPPNHLQAPYHFLTGNPRFRFNKNHPLMSSHGNKQHPSVPRGIDDDFNNNRPVNHILIPHGKGITHALSFGKGYVPHDALTGSNFNGASISSQDNYPSQSVSQLPAIANHNNNNHNPYNQNNPNNFDLTAERRLEEIKSLIFKAKQLGLLSDNNNDYNNNEKSIITRDIESFTSQNNYYNNNNNNNNNNDNDKKGIIIRDTILYDDYNKKITELAKNWPTHVFNNNNKNMGIINVAELAAQNGFNIPAQFLRHINLHNGGIGSNNLLKQNSGYAVNEHVQDIPQDYNRYKPIAELRPNPTPVATAAAIVATGAQVVPQVPQGHNQQNSHLHPGYFSLHSPTIFHK
ncbi:Protein of unknown function [Cotesia congregata]|uniref:Uncharacterized protein n=1 Tax=Cotesia congregata TaxID=51543 RepID=A0A8J2H7G9_COTCN|nr:Protein of unknown function [Cotesia congregata]